MILAGDPMARRKRFRDRSKASGPTAIQYRPGESWRDRHARRKSFNSKFVEAARDWAKSRGVFLSITNDEHHWKFARGKASVQWWPSTAKCVVNERWRSGIHVHDWRQLKIILDREFSECS